MSKTDNSTQSYDKMMGLFQLFGQRKEHRSGKRRGGATEGVTLENAV